MNIGSQQTCRQYSVRTPKSSLVMSTTRMERSLETVSSFRRVFGLFKEYLKHLGVFSSTIAVVLMACALKGDIALILLLAYKSYISNFRLQLEPSVMQNTTSDKLPEQYEAVLPGYLQLHNRYGLKDLLLFVIMAMLSSQLVYHGFCGFLQWYYYTLQRDSPHKWKCQPHRFLTRENEIHEIIVGTTNMTIAAVGSGFLSCWIANGNYSSVYFKFDEYGYLYLVLSIPLLFLWVEATAYYAHKLLHVPWFYKNFHKQHHRYHSPTAYSLVAMSPFEMAWLQSYLIIPLFTAPINAVVFISVVMYVYYFGMIDHSGIKMKSIFPWQPDTMFHDDHHRYFHVNFGFNTYLFDWLHGTLRRPDREYGEDIFGGKGRKKD